MKAVPASSSQPEDIERETAKTEKKTEVLFELIDLLVDWLGSQEKSLRAAALHLARTRFDLGDRQETNFLFNRVTSVTAGEEEGGREV